MFVYSMKASTLKTVCAVCLSVAALIVLLSVLPTYEPTAASLMYSDVANYNYNKVNSNDDRIGFLKQFGIEVEKTPVQEQNVTIPSEFDKIYVCYNELQKQQGLDLSKYKRKEVTRYTYKVTNYSDYEGTVYADVIVYRGKVIGGHLTNGEYGSENLPLI